MPHHTIWRGWRCRESGGSNSLSTCKTTSCQDASLDQASAMAQHLMDRRGTSAVPLRSETDAARARIMTQQLRPTTSGSPRSHKSLRQVHPCATARSRSSPSGVS